MQEKGLVITLGSELAGDIIGRKGFEISSLSGKEALPGFFREPWRSLRGRVFWFGHSWGGLNVSVVKDLGRVVTFNSGGRFWSPTRLVSVFVFYAPFGPEKGVRVVKL